MKNQEKTYTATKPESNKVRLMFLGICHLEVNGKTKRWGGAYWAVIGSDESREDAAKRIGKDHQNGDIRVYSRKGFPPASPGTCYIFETGESGTSVYANKREYDGCADNEVSRYWEAKWNADKRAEQAELMERSEAGKSLNMEALEPLRRVYRRSGPAQRSAILLLALKYIQE